MLRWTDVQSRRTVAAISYRLLRNLDGIPGDLLRDWCLPTERLTAFIQDLVPDELSGVEQLMDVQIEQHACTGPCTGRVARLQRQHDHSGDALAFCFFCQCHCGKAVCGTGSGPSVTHYRFYEQRLQPITTMPYTEKEKLGNNS